MSFVNPGYFCEYGLLIKQKKSCYIGCGYLTAQADPLGMFMALKQLSAITV